jgi:hypothetical protein
MRALRADFLVADAVAPNRSLPPGFAQGIGKSIPLVRFLHFFGPQERPLWVHKRSFVKWLARMRHAWGSGEQWTST